MEIAKKNENSESYILNDDDMVFKKIDGKIQSAGFSVNSILMQKGDPLLITKNYGLQTGGGKTVSDLFKDLAVPAGLLQFKEKQFGGKIEESKIKNNDEIISDDIHDKLLRMVEVNGEIKQKKTRRTLSIPKNSKTKKQKI
jgi:hypothetical protein